MEKVVVIGAGFGGMGAAAVLAQAGHKVTVIDRHDQPGGRCRSKTVKGFRFDMGPSWYMMPEILERFFGRFGRKVEDYYELKELNPRYRMWLSDDEYVDVSNDIEEMKMVFEKYESGAGEKLEKFLAEARFKYDLAIDDYMYRPNEKIGELINWDMATKGVRLGMLSNYEREVRKYFKSEEIYKLMAWIVSFVGCSPSNAPGLYTLMNYADWGRGIYYPIGGMQKVSEAIMRVGEEMGVEYVFEEEVEKVLVKEGKVVGVKTNESEHEAAIVVNNGDYAWCETKLLDEEYRSFDKKYWDSRVYSPSVLVWHMGVKGTLTKAIHHTFYARHDVAKHFEEMFAQGKMPEQPLISISVVSKTDISCAPKGHENVYALIPVAAGYEDSEEVREKYWEMVMDEMEHYEGKGLRERLVVKESYGLRELEEDYHAWKGHGFGLANTLWQTAIFRPGIRSKKVKGLFYTGCMSVPGVGLPTSLVSGEIVGGVVSEEYKTR